MSTVRSVPAGNGVTWLTRGFGTVRKYPGALAGAVFLLILAIIIPVCIQLAAQFLLAGTRASMVVQLLASVLMLLLISLLMVGLLRLIDSLERTGSGGAGSIFGVFSDTELLSRAFVFALIVLVASAVFIVVLLMTLGPDMLGWYKTLITQPMLAEAAAPPITRSPWLAAGVGVVGAFLLFGINTFGYAQVALSRASGTEAFMDGLRVSASNLLAILVNMVAVIGAILLLVIPLVVLMMLLGFLGTMVHPLAGVVLTVPVYIGFMLGLYALVFATMYHAWRDVLGGSTAPAAAPVPPPQLQA